MRTAVPLVRRLDPNETGTIELEFDVPALEEDSAPAIFIGVRVKGADSTKAWDVADRLIDNGISVEVHLYQVQGADTVPVVLERIQRIDRDKTEFLALPASGLVSGLSITTADFSTMQQAGLIATDFEYKELKFAILREAPVGRYRVTIRFVQNAEVLIEENAELLIAYIAKGK